MYLSDVLLGCKIPAKLRTCKPCFHGGGVRVSKQIPLILIITDIHCSTLVSSTKSILDVHHATTMLSYSISYLI